MPYPMRHDHANTQNRSYQQCLRRQRGTTVTLVLLSVASALLYQGAALAQGHAHPVAPASYEDLLARASANGRLRVIVKLDIPLKPEGELSEIAAHAQRRRIHDLQNRVMHSALSRDISEVRRFKYTPHFATEVDALELRQLIDDPNVVQIVEDLRVPPTLEESIPLIGGGVARAGGFTGQGQTIAILDTGVEATHDFLRDKIVSEACYSQTFAELDTSVCPNGEDEELGSGAAMPCSFEGCAHGTHVAGIAAGKGDDFSGVAEDAAIIAIQVFHRHEDNPPDNTTCEDAGRSSPCPLSWTSDQMKALERVFELRSELNIAAANMSLGGGEFRDPCDGSTLKQIMDHLASVGVATVISAGNDGAVNAISQPACISTAISVGSVGDGSGGTAADEVSDFSNSAYFLDLLAPGQLIRSSIPGNDFSNFQGTSMAAPHVAGAWAAVKSVLPRATVDQILSVLKDSGVPVEDTRPGANSRMKPRINIGNLLCLPPASGDWIVRDTCVIKDAVATPAGLTVQNHATLVVGSTGSLDFDFQSHSLRVKPGARMIIKPGGMVN